ncbi:MAG: hypothetical protein M1821_000484 [Bathelium mastoideum]|nr:MAG: hypothetical protein M1821_000484 [Bathelium mastoideum]
MSLELQDELKRNLAAIYDESGGTFRPDEAVITAIPLGISVKSAHSYGHSTWSFTAKINAENDNGDPKPFFLKYVAGDLGLKQLQGEFVGMSELHKLMPNFVPKPIAWGKLRDYQPEAYFFLIEFKSFGPGLPNPAKLGARVAEMHKNSLSPTNMFGFHMVTYDGARPQVLDWDPSWASFFSKLVTEAYRQHVETNVVWKELEMVFQRTVSHVIPRLLGVLQSDGRSIKPCLIHGDMWEGNIGNDIQTGDPWIFDPAAYYAHHEMELGIWAAERHKLRAKPYRVEYLRNIEPSEPKAEFDDRIRLYRCKTNFMFSAIFPGCPSRQEAFNDLVFLIDKYVPWDDEVKDHFKDTDQLELLGD